ncbi:CheR family methyltransferase [Thermodesulfobacteriota bacterium]
MDDQHFRQLLIQLEFSWSGYRKVRKGVKKRIRRHMQKIGCHTTTSYLEKIKYKPEIREECERLMTVSISRFFRDRQFWLTLQKKLLPDMINLKRESARVWSAGCACGEEVYSFNMVWDCMKKSNENLPEIEITATDLNPVVLEKAKAGVYRAGSLKEVPSELRSLYFDTKSGGTLFEVKHVIKKNITWKHHHILKDPPGSIFDIIFLRNNLLTYYQDRQKKAAFTKIVDCLSPSGVLIIGSNELLPFDTDQLVPVTPYQYVFRKDA